MYDSIVTRPATWADLPACLEVEHAAMKAIHYLADVADQGTLPQDAAPAWAYQAVVNLSAVGILEDRTAQKETLSAPLTRAQAAEMLQSAMEVLDFRKKIW